MIILYFNFMMYHMHDADIREYDGTLYVGMVQCVSNSQYIGIGSSLARWTVPSPGA